MKKVYLTRSEVDTIMAFANGGMKVQRAADAMHYDKRTVSQRLTLIHANTGIDPRDFWGLTRLVEIIKNQGEEVDHGDGK